MRARTNRLTFTFRALLLFICYAALLYQLSRNFDTYAERREDIQQALAHPHYHPILIVSKGFEGFGLAAKLMARDSARRYWVICDDFYPPVLMNFYLYPEREMRMAVNTQLAILRNWLRKQEQVVEHVPPEKYEKIVEVLGNQARLLAKQERNH